VYLAIVHRQLAPQGRGYKVKLEAAKKGFYLVVKMLLKEN
jgi:hypothetical protein